MRKRLSVLIVAAALSLGLVYGGSTFAQPTRTPPPGVHFPGDHSARPDLNGPNGPDFKRPDGRHPGQDVRDNFGRHKKDFQDRKDHAKKDFKDKMRKGKKYDRRGDGRDFRPGDHKGRPEFDRPGKDFRPGDHKGRPDFGKPGEHRGGPDFGRPDAHRGAPDFGQPRK